MSRRRNVVSIRNETVSVKELPTNEELLTMRCREMRRASNAPDYLKHERENFKAIVRELPVGTNLLTLDTDDLESMVFDRMRDKALKPNTINGRIKTLRRLYAVAMRHGIIDINPALDVSLSLKVKEGIPSLEAHQIPSLLQQPNRATFVGLRDHCAIALMIDTGIRLREMLDLGVEQVDLGERLIRSVRGKNRRVQNIPISEPMRDIFDAYLAERGELECHALFVSVDNRPLKRRSFQERLKHYGEMAGIQGVRVSPHTLRHTFAKQWILAGGDAISLRDMLRHSTMDQAADYVMFFSREIGDLHDKHSPLVTLHLN